MATELDSKIQLTVTETLSKTFGLSSDVKAIPKLSPTNNMDNGVLADQADLVYSKSGVLAASGNDQLDLNGSLVDEIGNSVDFAKIKGMFLVNTSDSDAELEIGGGTDGAGTNAFSTWLTNGATSVKVPWKAFHALTAPKAGFVVTAGSGDILRIENKSSSNGATYELILVGTSA
jgi:hypothetical protein